MGTEVDGASSRPAPHTALAAIAEAPQGRPSHSRWTDKTAGTPGEMEMEEGRRGEERIEHVSDHALNNDSPRMV